MKKIINSKIFLGFFIATFAIGLIVFLNSFKGFQSQMDILLIPKSVVVAQNSDKIQSDTAKIISSVRFYDQLLEAENVSTEITLGEKASKRKEAWQKKISVEKSKNSNVLSILAHDNSALEAEKLSQKVARNISDEMSRYYNIKNELDIRIIDGPISEKQWLTSSLVPWILSLIFAFASGVIAFLIFNSIEFVSKSKTINLDNNYFTNKLESSFSEEPYDFSTIMEDSDIPEETTETPAEENESEVTDEKDLEIFPLIEDELPKEEHNATEIRGIDSRSASAPANLPIADDSNLNFQEEDILTNDEQSSQKEILEILEKAKANKETGVHEATPEEVKARLNRLLKGNL